MHFETCFQKCDFSSPQNVSPSLLEMCNTYTRKDRGIPGLVSTASGLETQSQLTVKCVMRTMAQRGRDGKHTNPVTTSIHTQTEMSSIPDLFTHTQ